MEAGGLLGRGGGEAERLARAQARDKDGRLGDGVDGEEAMNFLVRERAIVLRHFEMVCGDILVRIARVLGRGELKVPIICSECLRLLLCEVDGKESDAVRDDLIVQGSVVFADVHGGFVLAAEAHHGNVGENGAAQSIHDGNIHAMDFKDMPPCRRFRIVGVVAKHSVAWCCG